MSAIAVIGVFLSLTLVIFLAYRKVNSFIAALAGAVVIIVTNGMNFWDSITSFMKGGMDFLASSLLSAEYTALFLIRQTAQSLWHLASLKKLEKSGVFLRQ